jgi:hypothetical protein
MYEIFVRLFVHDKIKKVDLSSVLKGVKFWNYTTT